MTDEEILKQWPFEIGQEVFTQGFGACYIKHIYESICVSKTKDINDHKIMYTNFRGMLSKHIQCKRILFHSWEIEELPEGGFRQNRPIGADSSGNPVFGFEDMHTIDRKRLIIYFHTAASYNPENESYLSREEAVKKLAEYKMKIKEKPLPDGIGVKQLMNGIGITNGMTLTYVHMGELYREPYLLSCKTNSAKRFQVSKTPASELKEGDIYTIEIEGAILIYFVLKTDNNSIECQVIETGNNIILGAEFHASETADVWKITRKQKENELQ